MNGKSAMLNTPETEPHILIRTVDVSAAMVRTSFITAMKSKTRPWPGS